MKSELLKLQKMVLWGPAFETIRLYPMTRNATDVSIDITNIPLE